MNTELDTVRRFWDLMASNDFESVGAVLADDFLVDFSFFTVVDGKVARLVEFWPDPFGAPANRAHLVEVIS
jgi:ketosteroid isomerase-like protein